MQCNACDFETSFACLTIRCCLKIIHAWFLKHEQIGQLMLLKVGLVINDHKSSPSLCESIRLSGQNQLRLIKCEYESIILFHWRDWKEKERSLSVFLIKGAQWKLLKWCILFNDQWLLFYQKLTDTIWTCIYCLLFRASYRGVSVWHMMIFARPFVLHRPELHGQK